MIRESTILVKIPTGPAGDGHKHRQHAASLELTFGHSHKSLELTLGQTYKPLELTLGASVDNYFGIKAILTICTTPLPAAVTYIAQNKVTLYEMCGGLCAGLEAP